ncbi:MAG: lytic transglycosylase domain-containing protein [Bdellovibrionales bacterium]
MGYFIRYTHAILSATVFLMAFFACNEIHTAMFTATAEELPHVAHEAQLEHSVELLNASPYIFAGNTGRQEDMRQSILETVQRLTPPKYRKHTFEIAYAVIAEANHHRMDPLFLLAVIQTESGFDPNARGRHGEVGLMQIRPSTAKWLAAQAGMAGEEIHLENPAVNIRIGATYFASLRRRFNGIGSRYMAAYNMGATAVRRLVASETEPMIYPKRVMKHYKSIYHTVEITASDSSRREIASLE